MSPPRPAAASRPLPSDDAQLALVSLVAAGGAGAPRRRLLEAYPDPRAALAAGPSAWRGHGLTADQCQALRQPDAAARARARDWLAQAGHGVVGWSDPDYPPLLRRIASPPVALFVAGEPARLWHPLVAMVGTRAPSAGGREHAFEFAHALAASGMGVGSGLAAGIDTAAHEGALAAGGLTVAVLGTGPDIAYPRGNAALLTEVARRGVVVSEHLPGTGPQRSHFPRRNRILAGLCLGTLVIEAAGRSGALITARLAAEAGREVMALPGSIGNPLARGCHRLIRDGAALVEEPAEVLSMLAPLAACLAGDLRGRLGAPNSGGVATSPGARDCDPNGSGRADPDYQRLWLALGHDPTGMDRLVERTALTAAQLSAMLLVMELEGRVVNEHGRYTRNGDTRKSS